MELTKVVVRYGDGRILKGYTQDFFPSKDRFRLHPAAETPGKGTEIFVKDLKAVFFVRDFAGNPQYNERKYHLAENETEPSAVVISAQDNLTVWFRAQHKACLTDSLTMFGQEGDIDPTDLKTSRFQLRAIFHLPRAITQQLDAEILHDFSLYAIRP